MNKLIIIVLALFTINGFSQEKWFRGSVYSNAQYYLDDSETGDFNNTNRFRSNNYLTITGGIKKFTAGFQLEGYAPQPLLNYSESFNKEIDIATYFINYKTDKVDLQLGYFYEQFGNGLILRFWEDKQLGLNNALRGGKFIYTPTNFFKITGLYGNQRVGFDVSKGTVLGVNTEFNLNEAFKFKNSNLNVGFSFVSRNQEVDAATNKIQKATNAFSGSINFSKNQFYSNIEVVRKAKDALVEFEKVNSEKLNAGNALLVNTGYSKKGFGIDLTLRRLENMAFYSDREAQGNVYNEQLINYLPSLNKQQDYSLANIYVYQTQADLRFNPFGKSGEMGGQISLFYTIKKETFLGGKNGVKLALNYSNWNGLKATYNLSERTYKSNYFEFGNKYFSQFNLEIRKKWSKQWASIFSFTDLFYSKKYIEETVGDVNATIFVGETTYKFSRTKSIRLEAQHLWSKDDKRDWLAATTEFNFSPKFSMFVSDMYNYGNESSKIHYYNVGGSYTKGATRIALNYGRQRGGLLCVGGVCRIVPESTGIGIALNTSF